MFLRHFLTQLQRATADGVPVKGYFEWSTMDNFEWNAGFGNRFGLVHVDFKTQRRTPRCAGVGDPQTSLSPTHAVAQPHPLEGRDAVFHVGSIPGRRAGSVSLLYQ